MCRRAFGPDEEDEVVEDPDTQEAILPVSRHFPTPKTRVGTAIASKNGQQAVTRRLTERNGAPPTKRRR
ncbi:MAG: hypothetical protein QG626_213 [Patescibacteria group bacterium]|jgi:hypothetical protein|nr:hypothetical protein [Patescibacteria group bacterium]